MNNNCNNHPRRNTHTILTYVMNFGFYSMLCFLIAFPIPQANRNIIESLIYSYTGVYLVCMAYWFKSTILSKIGQNIGGK